MQTMSRPARAAAIARRQRAASVDRRIDRLTSRGMSGVLTELDRGRSDVIAAVLSRRELGPGLDRMFLSLGRASLEAMLAGHMTALHDVRVQARLTSRTKRATGFGPYSDAVRVARERAKLTTAQVQDLQRRYGAVVLDIVEDARRATERKLVAAVEGIISDNLHVDDGIARLNAAFDAAGLTPRHRHQVEAIVRSQVQFAYSAGAVQADRDPAVAEILWGYTYSTVGDDRVRPTHEAMDGVTLPKEHPFWRTNMPPNGWNCRCTALREFGLGTASEIDIELVPVSELVEIDGELIVPGADEGWQFNPGDLFPARQAA